MAKLRVGVIGTGTIARVGHLPHYQAHPDVELVALADVDADRAQVVADEFGASRVYTDVTEMFKQERLDAVSICTPNHTHAPLTLLAFENGVDVLVEKPLCTDVAQAEQVVRAAEGLGRICMVGMTHRFRNEARAIKRFIEAGDLGQIYYAKTRILRRRGTPAGWFTDKSKSGGGPLMDIGVHALDLAWWLVGTPTAVSVSGQLVQGIGRYDTLMSSRWQSADKANQDNAVFDVEDFASAYIRFDTGMVLQLEVSWALNGPQDDALKVDIFGSRGGISLDPLVYYTEQNRILVESHLSIEKNDFYRDEINHFVHAVQTREQPLPTVRQGAEVVRMLDAIVRSADARREVVLGGQEQR
jgi:predicted dehydrogenase